MAPRVQFYHNTPDRLVLTRELVANAHERGRKIAICCADAAQLKRLDQLLWTAEPLSFIPHVAIESALAGETPVVLAVAEAAGAEQVAEQHAGPMRRHHSQPHLIGHDDGVRRALFGYNRAIWYVNDVLAYAQHYATQACTTEAGELPDGLCPPSGSAAERGLQPAALRALRCVKAAFPWITSMGGVGNRPNTSDHPAGRAVDFMIPSWNTTEGRARGWQVARWLQTHATELNVKYVIYDDHVWRAYRPSQGWTPYTHPNGPTSNPTLRHLDHVHLSVQS